MLTCQSSVGYKLNFAASYKFGKEYSKEEFERSETLYNIACMSDLLYILVSAPGSTWHGGYCGGTDSPRYSTLTTQSYFHIKVRI